MRILHIITSLHTGGAEKLLVDLLPRFRDMGHDVELLLFDGTETPFHKELSNAGIKIHSLSKGGNVYNPINIFRVREYLKRFDIIHTHNTACQYFASIASRLSRHKGKLVTTEHNTTNRRRGIPFFRLIDKWMYQRYERIICIADSTASNLEDFIGKDQNIRVINNGIDVSKFRAASQNKVYPDKEVIISMIAAFRPQKNQDALIKAMSLLPDNYRLWLVGDGIRRKSLEALTDSLGLNNRVEFLGVRTDIPAIMEKSHIIVLSSHWEGFGLSSVEGCASGRPVIASDVQGLREVIGGAGILFPDGDYEKLAQEISHLSTDSDYYDLIAKRCQNRANDYDINKMARRYNEVYLSMIN